MTVGQIRKAAKNHKYLLLREKQSGILLGFNSAVILNTQKNKSYRDGLETRYSSFKPCSIVEYIERKVKFKL